MSESSSQSEGADQPAAANQPNQGSGRSDSPTTGPQARTSGDTPPGSNQPGTQPVPTSQPETAPGSGNLGSSDPQAPVMFGPSTTGGAPHAMTSRRSDARQRPIDPEGREVEPPADGRRVEGVGETASLARDEASAGREGALGEPAPTDPASRPSGPGAAQSSVAPRPSAPDGEVSPT